MTPPCYAGRILRVDLSSGATRIDPTSDYVRFVGGRGLGAKIYWDDVPPTVHPFDPENEVIFVTGPMTGFAGTGTSRWQACFKSPIADRQGYSYSNLGGVWGVALKSAGYDALVVRGRAEHLVYLLIDPEGASIVDATPIKGLSAVAARETLKAELGDSCSVAAIGPAGENKVLISTMVADKDANGAGGLGSVMGSKLLKAIAVRAGDFKPAAARPEALREATKYLRHLVGKHHRLTDLLPQEKRSKDYCWGCPGPCNRYAYHHPAGIVGKFMCQDAFVYRRRSLRYYDTSDHDFAFLATRLCNEYGLDTMAVDVMMVWLTRCHEAGLIDDATLGAPISQIGSWEFISKFLRRIALREGMGDLLAEGTAKAAQALGPAAQAQMGDALHKAEANGLYGPRLYIPNGIIFAMEPRQPKQQLHEISFVVDSWIEWLHGKEGAFVSDAVVRAVAKRFWGGEAAADLTTYEGKALAAKMVQDRTLAKEAVILCDYMWPVLLSPQTRDRVGDPSLESKILSAATGWTLGEEDYYRLGEKALLLQRAIMVREGHRGRLDDSLPAFCFDAPLKEQTINPEMLVPGPQGKPVCRQGSVIARADFEAMKDDYYRLRGWDVQSGLPPDQGWQARVAKSGLIEA